VGMPVRERKQLEQSAIIQSLSAPLPKQLSAAACALELALAA
jgi:hypothetical protein